MVKPHAIGLQQWFATSQLDHDTNGAIMKHTRGNDIVSPTYPRIICRPVRSQSARNGGSFQLPKLKSMQKYTEQKTQRQTREPQICKTNNKNTRERATGHKHVTPKSKPHVAASLDNKK